MPLPPITLTGRHVQLEPLTVDHTDDLVAAATPDRSTFGWTIVPDGAEAMRTYIDGLLADHANGDVLPFAQRNLATGDVVGCTRFFEPRWYRGRREPDEVEIGGTWLGAAAQRTPINTEAKLLLLSYAFEQLDVWRVAVCTDSRNHRSRTAIERIGATFEGILRSHRIRTGDFGNPSGEVLSRDTATYSIVAAEWAPIRDRLTRMLA